MQQVLPHRVVLVVSLLLVVGFTQHTAALPSPDFGVRATINPARADVLSESGRLRTAFERLTETNIRLQSGTPMLAQMETAILSIANQLRTGGMLLTAQLQALARSNGPSISDAFNPVYGTIQALHDLTISGVTGEMMSIAQVVASSVTQKFNQVFGNLRRSLNYLQTTLNTLEANVRQARSAAGSASVISETIVRNNVPAKTQSDVAKALIDLRVQVDVVRYVVRTTLLYLQDADQFLRDVMREVNSFDSALSRSLENFEREMNRLRQSTTQYTARSFGCSLAEQTALLTPILPALRQVPQFSSTLQQPLDDLLARLKPSFLSTVLNDFADRFNGYTSSAVSIESDQQRFVREESCELLKRLVLTLIAFGSQNEYCFNLYSAQAFGLYRVHHNVVSECFEAETERLTTMADFLRDTVDLLLYEVEDVADNLAVCVTLVNGRADCVSQYGGKYTLVVQLFTTMLSQAMQFYVEEFGASSGRLGACVTASQQKTLGSVTRLSRRLEECQQMELK